MEGGMKGKAMWSMEDWRRAGAELSAVSVEEAALALPWAPAFYPALG